MSEVAKAKDSDMGTVAAVTTLSVRGAKNVRDAIFVQEHFLPLAMANGKFNIVVFECYRVAELFLKALLCRCAIPPWNPRGRNTHDLPELVDALARTFAGAASGSVRWFAGQDRLNGYLLQIDGGYVRILRRVNGLYTLLLSNTQNSDVLSAVDALSLEITRSGSEIHFTCGQREVFRIFDSSVAQLNETSLELIRVPGAPALDRLKSLGTELRQKRETAFYSEVDCSEAEAKEANAALQEFLAILGGAVTTI